MGFEASVGYYVKVMPYNSEGAGLSAGPGEGADGDGSETVGVDAPVAAPGGSEDVELNPLEPTSLRVEWSPPTDTGGKGIVRYVVQRVSSTDSGNVATSSPVSAAGALLPSGARRRPRQQSSVGLPASWSEPSAYVGGYGGDGGDGGSEIVE
jgi:hypothetical protein